MPTLQELETRRQEILDEICSIRSMRRGTINEQFFEVRLKGRKQAVRRGPYYVLSRREGDKTVSQRLTSPEALEQARKDIEAYKRFQALCREFEQMTVRLSELDRSNAQEKKRSNSGLSKTGK